VADQPHVTTAAELDAMTPAERHQHFLDSIVRPENLTPAQRAWVLADQERVIADLSADDEGGRRAS
jgi:hypothetical protein